MGSKGGIELAQRLREVRIEHEGRHGESSLAEEMKLPARTWMNYESGVAIPGMQLLRLIERTGIHPIWLLTGCGNRYLEPAPPRNDFE